jgi:hypothetical protein
MADTGNRHPLTWGTNGIAATLAGGAQFVLSTNHFLGGCLAILAGAAFITAIFLEYSRHSKRQRKQFPVVAAVVGLLVVSADIFVLVTYKPPAAPVAVQATQPTPASASAEGSHVVSIAGGSNNSVTFSDTASPGDTPRKTKKGQK